MTEPAAIVYTVEPMDTLSISILVLFFGMFLSRHFKFLRDNYIPPAVSGGLVFSTLTALAFWISWRFFPPSACPQSSGHSSPAERPWPS